MDINSDNSFDIVLINVPSVATSSPLLAPALLKSSVLTAGFTAKTIDFNIKFNTEYIKEVDQYFMTSQADDQIKKLTESIIVDWVDEVLMYDPKWVGISIFTYQCRVAAEIFAKLLKSKRSDVKIVLGGSGIGDGGINGKNLYSEQLQQQGLIDHFIMSEAEISLVKLLQNDLKYPGIDSNSFNQIKNIDSLPFPDFDDYNFSQYPVNKRLPIYGSRGCVRRCSFCDIHQHWKYTFRTGQSIAEEMIAQSKKYRINEFHFMDSLVNGSLKEFRNFLKYMAEYNANADADKKITWIGYYIVRDPQAEGKEHWELMERSGAKQLIVGIESGSEKVRYEMNKKFKNSDVDYLVKKLVKHNIICVFLMIIGYVTETEKDYEDSLNFIRKYKHLAGKTIFSIHISDTLSILPGTPLFDNLEKLGIVLDPKHENNWISTNNPTLTLSERIRRVGEAKKLVKELGYNEQIEVHELLSYLSDNVKIFDTRINLIKKIIEIKKI